MRHSVYGKKLGRDKNSRNALFKSLVSSLILFEKIETTQAKAKAVKGLVDKIINQAKNPHSRRLVSQFLTRKEVQEKLVRDLVPRLESRNSGYTSVVKVGYRKGDGSLMVQMRLMLEEKREKETEGKRERETKPPQASLARLVSDSSERAKGGGKREKGVKRQEGRR